MTNKPEIKPCPFCRNLPRKAYVDTLCCNNKTCPIFDYPFKTSDWNTRAEPATSKNDTLASKHDTYTSNEPTSKPHHKSDCALHNGPAMIPGPCDCGADPEITPEKYGSEFPAPEPAAPSSDEVDRDLCAVSMVFPETAQDLRAHIAALEADNKRLREAICDLIDASKSSGYPHESLKRAEAALAQTDGKAGG